MTKPTKTEINTAAPAATPPESWSARDAWKFLGMILVFSFILWSITGASWRLLHWHRSGLSHLVLDLANYTVKILTALYFARTESWALFQKAFGFELTPTTYTWFAIVYALIIRGFGHTLIAAGWTKGVYISSIWNFRHTYGLERFLYAFPLIILAPLCEEIYMRGFLYRAFRGSYSVELSTLLIVAVTAYTHWDQFRQSGIAAVDVTAITIVQCYLRERTGKLQDCIACHFAYNASGLLLSAMRHGNQ